MRFLPLAAASLLVFALACKQAQRLDPETAAEVRELRNLGKAFYENPGASEQAVETLKQAFDLDPESPRERLNYGLALLRAGRMEEGLAEVERVQEMDPSLPHTYFNLGVEYKKAGDAERAIAQFEKMAELTPDEAKVHYNLGQLYKQLDREAEAIDKFETAARLDPAMAAPHFQLYNMFRRSDRARAAEELEEFKRLKALQDETGLSEDVNWSFYSELHDPIEPGEPAEVAAEVAFEAAPVAALGSGDRAGVLTLDFDGDGDADLLAWSSAGVRLLRNDGGSFSLVEDSPALGGWTGVRGIDAGDPDNDGFPDLCVAAADGARVLRNVEGRFESSFAPSGSDVEACLWHDFDHDGDADVFFVGATNALRRYSGDETVPFEERFGPAEFPFEAGKRGLAIATAELFEDDGIDAVIAYEDDVVLYQDRKLGRYDRDGAIDGVRAGAAPVRFEVVDLDNDGYLDVVMTAGEGRSVALRNERGRLVEGPEIERALSFADLQNRGWADAVGPDGAALNEGEIRFTEAATSGLPAAAAAVAADFNGDGKIDLAVADASGEVHVALNRTETSNNFVALKLVGVKSAKLARGARVEVKAGEVYRKRVYRGVPLTFGLGGRDEIETIRITWTNGMIQNETNQPVNQVIEIEEKPRLSGSCPMIFTWNGKEFEYISEVLGVAPLGASLGDGEFFPVDHDEYVWIDGEQLVERDGRYEVRITEELRETAYLDQVRLIAVDHPADVEIHTNEKFKAPPFPEFRLFGVRDKIRPAAATDHRGQDVLDRLLAADGRYADGFERTFRNTAEPHWVTLDFPALKGRDSARLFLRGWVDWADASTIVAGSQTSARGIAPPVLQVRDRDGNWKTVNADLGLPGGRPRVMSVDLTGLWLSDSREIRIPTNMCLYWDEIFAAVDVDDPEAIETRAAPARAELRFRGFSENLRHPERKQPEGFHYAKVSPVSTWNPTPGRYTRFGDVRELLDAIDDRMVVMGAGDEAALEFDAAAFPALKPGWKRGFLLFVDGWAKENEANTAFGDTVEPLPFHEMSGYPYEGPGRVDPEYRRYLDEYNTRLALRLLRPLAVERLD